MADETEEIKVSPLIPTLKGIRLEIDGEIQLFDLRYDMLAFYRIAKEGRQLGEDNDTFMTIALTVKHFLWPRNHGLTVEQILEGISYEQMGYINGKIRELLVLNKVEVAEGKDGDPTVSLAPATNSQTNSGGNSKPAPGSASGSLSPNSGTPPRVN